MIDSNWRLDYVKERYPHIETIDFSKLGKGESVTSKLKEMCSGHGPDVALECVAGEYPKGWAHYFELMLGMETDVSVPNTKLLYLNLRSLDLRAHQRDDHLSS